MIHDTPDWKRVITIVRTNMLHENMLPTRPCLNPLRMTGWLRLRQPNTSQKIIKMMCAALPLFYCADHAQLCRKPNLVLVELLGVICDTSEKHKVTCTVNRQDADPVLPRVLLHS
jgi:hypothetical protein